MNKNEMRNKIWSAVKKYAPGTGIFVLSAVIMAFLLFHCLGMEHVRAVTIPAVKSVEYEISDLDGYVFRDEKVLYSNNRGAAMYFVGDGEKVRAQTELGRVYTYGSTEKYLAERRKTEARIEIVKQALGRGKNTAGGIDSTKSAVAGSYEVLMDAVGRRDLACADAMSREFLISLSARNLALGNDKGLCGELAELERSLDELDDAYSGSYESIYSEESCYFFYGCDGYEDVFNVGLLDTVDAAGLRKLAESGARPADGGDGRGVAVGKLVKNYEWYFAAAASRDICCRLEEGKSYEITFDDGRKLDMTLERLDSPGKGDGIMVFSSGVMPERFDYTRKQSVRLLAGKSEGYRVPADAIHQEKGIDGVYILSGSEVKFRRVTVLDRKGDYALVAERDLSTENYNEFLNLNDQIILSLSDGELYDGRILN